MRLRDLDFYKLRLTDNYWIKEAATAWKWESHLHLSQQQKFIHPWTTFPSREVLERTLTEFYDPKSSWNLKIPPQICIFGFLDNIYKKVASGAAVQDNFFTKKSFVHSLHKISHSVQQQATVDWSTMTKFKPQKLAFLSNCSCLTLVLVLYKLCLSFVCPFWLLSVFLSFVSVLSKRISS